MTNYDRIRSLSVEEMAKFFDGISDYADGSTIHLWIEWLNAEAPINSEAKEE